MSTLTLDDPGIFPIWICPIKGTRTPQIFAPHLLKEGDAGHFINFGYYGVPQKSEPIEQVTKRLEQKVREMGGRKVLYSRSYYSPEEFWQIYSKQNYEELRQKTAAHGVWHEIADKVLSV